MGPGEDTCIATPGHTDGSLSYVVEVDGVRVAFTGDLLYDSGQVWELYSLQKAEAGFTDYHGFLGARHALRDSLARVLAQAPDRLVPSHGRVIEEPASAMARLLDRIDDCYERYVGILTLRYDYPAIYESYEGCHGWMPIGKEQDPPDFLRHIGTSWLVISESGEALLTDCGSGQVVETVEGLVESGEITGVTEAWVTHYHDDHVDAYPEFQRRFDCVTRAAEIVADVVENPLAHRLPCGSPSVVRVDHRTRDGETWQWNEFTLTAYNLPGQTYYGGALVVDGRGARILFVGDSFSPAGIDDYCAGNRNFLGDRVGFQRRLDIIELVQPTHTFHCHIDHAVAFSEGEIRHMRANLRDREVRFGELFPWDHPNYGLDPHWVRCYPYEQVVHRGESATLSLEVTNHSSESRTVQCRPVFPRLWRLEVAAASADVQAKHDGRVPFRFRVPSDASICRTAIPFEVTYDARPLGQFREAVVVVSAD